MSQNHLVNFDSFFDGVKYFSSFREGYIGGVFAEALYNQRISTEGSRVKDSGFDCRLFFNVV